MASERASAIATYANVRTKTTKNVSPGPNCENTVSKAPTSHSSGFQVGLGSRKIGSGFPIAIARIV
jgi:hypothetical protein